MVNSLLTTLVESPASPRTTRQEPRAALLPHASESDRWMNQQLNFRANPAHLKSEEVADLYARANAYHCSGNLVEAQGGYKEILKKYPNHFDTLYMLAVSEQQRGDSQSAVRLLRRSLQVDPRSAQAWDALAAC